ncbi:MAG: YfhO family protein [Nitrospinaceae bacterium]|nr:MAG: YfhO family protein [Nitrospinaceae bacterium]
MPLAALPASLTSSSRRSRVKEGVVLSALGLLVLLLYYPAIFQGKTLFFRDISHFAYPMKLFTVQSWAQGEIPFWWPNVVGGTPFLALLHPGVFYPLNIIFFATADFVAAFNLYYIFHTLILVYSVYALCLYWGLSEEASFCSAVTALFGGYFLSVTSVYSHFVSAVWFPLFLLMFDKFLSRGGARYFFGAVSFLALQVLGGGVEVCILSVLTYYFYSLVMVSQRPWQMYGLRGKTFALAAISALALGFAALQLAPTYYLMRELNRKIGLVYATAAHWSAGPEVLSSLILPDKFQEAMVRIGYGIEFYLQNYYLGFFPMLLLLAVLARVVSNRAILFWASVFLVGLFFALGEYNPAYEWVYNWVPLVDKFRYPEKFLFLSSFAGVFIAGYGFDALFKLKRNASSRWMILILTGILSALAIAVVRWKPERHLLESLVIAAGLGCVIFLWNKGWLRMALFKTMVLILICLDLLLKNVGTIPMIDRKYYTQPPELAEKVTPSHSLYRVYSGVWSSEHIIKDELYYGLANQVLMALTSKERMQANLGTQRGINYVDGFTGLKLIDSRIREIHFNQSADDDIKRSILAKNNVKYLVSLVDQVKSTEDHPLGEMELEELADVLPRAYLVGDADFAPYPYIVKKFFDPAFDASKKVLLSNPVQWNRADNFDGRVLSLDHTPNRVTLKTRQNGEGFLVLLDSYFPGWTVTVDGKTGRIYRGNFFYRAVKLGPGEHTVEFTFQPVGFKLGWMTSIATGVLTLFIAGVPRVRKRLFET